MKIIFRRRRTDRVIAVPVRVPFEKKTGEMIYFKALSTKAAA